MTDRKTLREKSEDYRQILLAFYVELSKCPQAADIWISGKIEEVLKFDCDDKESHIVDISLHRQYLH